ncbi:GNAT family N-acetyltransferase [Fictibacillus phosphorivorans]|uniref:GNAT family N-acetyltransferase n=1 Tax=Fictibacillus phosphorivorans TaxID=1221500 RepID=UPI0035E64481
MKSLKSIDIQRASGEDLQMIMSLLKDCAQWLKDRNIDQWRFFLGGGEDTEIKRAIERNHTYKVTWNEQLVATFTLSPEQTEWDEHIFGKDEVHASLYLHRLAVRPSFMNKGIGKEIVNWIQANVEHGREYIKLDCVANNIKLNQFYVENGFEYIGEFDNHSKYMKPLFRRKDERNF